jgi:hypothetical protein
MTMEWHVNKPDKLNFDALLEVLHKLVHSVNAQETPAILDTSDCLPYSQPLIRRRWGL